MKIRIKIGLLVSTLTMIFAPILFVPAIASAAESAADAKAAVCEGISAATGSSGCEDPDGSSTLNGTVTNAINIISVVVAVIAVIMIIVGGLKYVTSQGESAATASARNTIIYAAVGLVVVSMAQIIVKFVVNRATPVQGSNTNNTIQVDTPSQPTQPRNITNPR